jgi:hypothetical protein
VDNGRNQSALQYCEMLANDLLQPPNFNHEIASKVIELSTRLKMFDPTLALSGDTEKDPDWLTNLKCQFDNAPKNVLLLFIK